MTDILWTFFFILLALDLLFAAARVSLLNARLPRLFDLRDEHPEEINRTLELLEKPRLRASLRLGVVVLHFLLAGLSVCLFSVYFPGGSLLPALGLLFILALLLLVIEFFIEGQILPKAEEWAMRLSAIGSLLDLLVSPFSLVLVALLGSPAMLQQRLSPVTEDELKTWAEAEQPEGSLEKGERRMIYSIFQFSDTLCREVMVPRLDIFALDITTPLEDALRDLTKYSHSRVPVFEGTIDNVIGLLYVKDLLNIDHKPQTLETLRPLLRAPYFVPEAKKVDELLREMQAGRIHMAVVVDEYGGIAGLVTLEDIVEEIVGEIRDEYDGGEEQPYQQVGENEYIFQGRTDMAGFNEIMGCDLERDIADTLGGFIYARVGRVPLGGEEVVEGDIVLKVEQVSGRRIQKVRAFRRPIEIPGEEKEHEHD